MKLYQRFVENFTHIQLLRQIKNLLDWDHQTYMPVGAAPIRAKQSAYIAGWVHQEIASGAYRRALEEMVDIETGAIKIEGLTLRQKANLREWCRDLKHVEKIPISFIKEYCEVTSIATEAWKEAKQASKFSYFQPWLEKIVQLNKKKSDFLGYVNHPYDALLDLYEPGMTSSTLSILFMDLASFLPDMIQMRGQDSSPYEKYFQCSFEQEGQMVFSRLLLNSIGVSNKYTRLDCSAHPFCNGIHPSDVRLTTNLDSGLLENIFSVLHEGGHALYELGFSKEEWGTPSAEAASYGLHESQSRWWEVMVGGSMPFWEFMYPKLQTQFPQLQSLSLTNFYYHINQVKPSCIRIHADEVTYPLHIILRFEIEKQLLEGTLYVADIPAIWNAKMKDLLGITPKNDAEGCLQDIHWALGMFGYFPSYALGNIYAAQYFNAFSQSFPDWKSKIANGSFAFMCEWLREHIHQFGRMYNAAQNIERVTGSTLSIEPYKNYITTKYKKLWEKSL